jgi:Thioredoxin
MSQPEQGAVPTGHTGEGGVRVGRDDAPQTLVVFEDPQCPHCRQFEEVNGGLISTLVEGGGLTVEYRMRCFLGPESVRADNALALAAEAGRFDALRRELFARQPEEGTGGFTVDDLLRAGADVDLDSEGFVSGVRAARYEPWVLARERRFAAEDPQGTPAAWLEGSPVDAGVLFDRGAFARVLGA